MLINTTIFYHQNLDTIIFWNNEQYESKPRHNIICRVRVRFRDRKNEIDSERFSKVDRNGEDMFFAEYISYYHYIVYEYGEGDDFNIIFTCRELPAKL